MNSNFHLHSLPRAKCLHAVELTNQQTDGKGDSNRRSRVAANFASNRNVHLTRII